jgi:hypothetical protein
VIRNPADGSETGIVEERRELMRFTTDYKMKNLYDHC